MCYAIPGRVVNISGKQVILEYFGETKRAFNEFIELTPGDYIYVQGGFVINKITPQEAQETLRLWEELFFKLKEIDLRLSRTGPDLYKTANALRQKHLGNSCCVHGIIEFSNHCQNNCFYCGIRKDNQKLERYRMSVDEIAEAASYAVNTLGFKALVLQSGEDLFYTDEMLVEIVNKIRERCAVLLFISSGERNFETYQKLYQAGARGVLLRFETSKPKLYRKIKPGYELENRVKLIEQLYSLGYLIITGSLIGLPGQTEADIMEDIKLIKDLKAEMYSFGPLIPHPDTPFADLPKPDLELVLKTIARARIFDPEAKIVVTTALETLDKENGARRGLMAGANSLMINVTPKKYRKLYEIYPQRAGSDAEVTEQIKKTIDLLYSLGRAPTDLGSHR